MEIKKQELKISILGEFTDRNFESEFINNYLGRTIRFIRRIMLALGILYLLFIIPDYFLIKNPVIFKIIFVNRTTFLLAILALLIATKRVKNYTS
jgi:hypothetical protein